MGDMTLIEGGDRFQTGDRLKLGNAGAAKGSYDWPVSEPGYYRLVGEKGSGKSTAQFLLRQLHLPADEVSIPISHGEASAWIEFGPRSLRVEISPAGIPQEPVASGPEVSIEGVPRDIWTIVHGDRLKSADLRAERRVGALLAYAPILTTPDHLNVLLGCLLAPQGPGLPPKARAFGEISEELKRSWHDLTFALRESKKLAKYQQPRNPAEIRAWLEAQPAKKIRSILGMHSQLVDLLNQTANTGRKAAAEQRTTKDRLAGQLQQAVATAGVSAAELAKEYDLERLKAEKQGARESLQGVRFDRKVRVNAEAERVKLSQSHGERPVADASRRDQLAAAIEPAEERFQDAEQEVHRRRVALENAQTAAEHASIGAFSAWGDCDLYFSDVKFECGSPEVPGDVKWSGKPVNVEMGTSLLEALAASLAADPQAEVSRQQELVEAAQGKRQDLRDHLSALQEDFAREQERFETAEQQAKAWDETDAMLKSPVEGPEESAVIEAAEVAESAEEAVRIAEAAEAYQTIAAKHKAAMEIAHEIDLLVKAYVASKEASWDALGQVVTDTLKSPWLQVDGTRLFFGFDRQTGELNQDMGAVDRAKAAAQAAMDAAADPSSPVAGARFLERVREHSVDVVWKDADDNEQVAAMNEEKGEGEAGWALSRAQLIEGVLGIWFLHQPDGAVRTVPDELGDAFDEATDAEFASRCEGKRMRVIGARARRAGDPEGLHLERVGGRS